MFVKQQKQRLPESVLIVKIQGMGDLVLATPAIRGVREAFPSAHLAVAGKSNLIDILANEPYIDERIALGGPWDSGAIRGLLSMWRSTSQIRRRRFDLLINLTTLLSYGTWLKCSIFNRLCRPTQLIESQLGDCLIAYAKGERIRLRHTCHESKMNFRVLRDLVIPPPQITPTLLCQDNRTSPKLTSLAGPITRPSIGVCPGGKQTHRWPIERFVDCLRYLRQSVDAHFVILGDRNEVSLAQVITNALGGWTTNLCGTTSTAELPSLLGRLNLLLTNDTGLMHVAAAVGTPLVAIFGAGSPERFGPLAHESRCRVLFRPTSCNPCLQPHCSHRQCTAWITSEMVANIAVEMLKNEPSGASRG